MEKEKRFEEKRKSLFPYLRGQAAAVALAGALSIGMAHSAIAETPNNNSTSHPAANVVKRTNWMFQSGISMTKPRTTLPLTVKAVKREQANGYGYMAVGNGVTNNSYICQVGLGYNWPMQDGTYKKGFGVVVTAFRPDGSLYTLAQAENAPIIKEFDGTIKEGQYIQFDMSISNGIVTIVALNTFEKKEIVLRLHVKGAKEFVGSNAPFNKIGMETGVMVEEHLINSNDILTSKGAPVTILMAPNNDKVYLWGFESNVRTDQVLFRRTYGNPIKKGSIKYFGLRTSYDSSEAALILGSNNK